jgi:hypothetical protein
MLKKSVLLLFVAFSSIAVGYEIITGNEKNFDLKSQAKQTQTDTKALLRSIAMNPLKNTNQQQQLREERLDHSRHHSTAPHLTSTAGFFVSNFVNDASHCSGETGAYMILGENLNEYQCQSAGNGIFYSSSCTSGSGGINMITTYYTDSACTTQSSTYQPNNYFMASCSSSNPTTYYTCNTNPTPWQGISGQVNLDYNSDSTCSSDPAFYFILVGGKCACENSDCSSGGSYEVNCPNYNYYQSNDCTGNPYAQPVSTFTCEDNQGQYSTQQCN